VKYLRFLVERQQQRVPQRPEELQAAEHRLQDWGNRILANPELLSELRGVHEWAYESPTDGSGQPFRLHVPVDYDGKQARPLTLLLHGYAGNHLEHSTDMQAHPGYFEAAVLGRSRGAGFRGLGEADVLHVLDYLQRYFKIDPQRVHLGGGSMGAEGSYWLAARYPHRFASVHVACGWATSVPLRNLLSVPSYAVHSDDDYTVPVLMMRSPISELKRLGATVRYEEVTGYGHAVWNHYQAAARARNWSQQQVAPPASAQRRIDFTALDGVATRAYWAEISEWGEQPSPSRMVLEAKANNELYAQFDNARSVVLYLAESPFDTEKPLQLIADGKPLAELPAPLPAIAKLVRTHNGFAFEPLSGEPVPRRHTPGGANQLYDGRPLLIIYGTGGSRPMQQAMLNLAQTASRSNSAAWSTASGDSGPDGVPHNRNLYGDLPYKADSEATAADLAQHHIILIGSALQNRVTGRLAPRLPASVDTSQITLQDGTKIPSTNHALGVLYKNPEAPDRLLYWVAAAESAGYKLGGLVPELMSRLTATDLVVTELASETLVATRAFDSDWTSATTPAGPGLPPNIKTRSDLALALVETVRRSNNADFAITGLHPKLSSLPLPTQTRSVAELSQLFYFESMGVLTLTGSELRRVHQLFQGGQDVQLLPLPKAGSIRDKQEYSVAVLSEQLWQFTAMTHLVPRSFALSQQRFGQALRKDGLAVPKP
jgi:poly(3-hydroxybutyrate) depolymerase